MKNQEIRKAIRKILMESKVNNEIEEVKLKNNSIQTPIEINKLRLIDYI
ncbi:MAG: hypothetical protein M3Q58_16295 [Bacteroidota bacterium]|nr:hypothetical protein [Bacteroidota bacterium]